jgi:RHS repeat-associated protein
MTTYEYDALGRQTRVTNALNQVTNFVYDDLGRLLSTISPTSTTSSTYDALGRVLTKTDGAGRTTSYTYDVVGQLKTVTDALGHVTTYTYDEVGNKIAQTDANGRTTTFAYDKMGRIIRRTLPGGQFETSTFTVDNQLATTTDMNGHTTTYNYDAVTGILLSKVGWNGQSVAYTYYPDGKEKTITRNGSATTTYYYDVQGRVSQVVSPTGTITYGYDIAGNRTSVALPSGTTRYEFDVLNRMTAVISPDGKRTQYTYNAVGNRATIVRPNGVTTTYVYDNGSRLKQVQNSVGASFTYMLDGSGKRLSMVNSVLGTTNYTYDAMGRLVQESGPAGTNTYTYDAVGNRLAQAGTAGSTTLTYDINDRLLSDGTKAYGYDANGNTISVGNVAFAYDFEDHLISSGSSQFVYDGKGNRIQQTTATSSTRYLVDELAAYAQVVEERQSGAGQLIARYDFGLEMVRMDRGNNSSYYLSDGLQSVIGLTDNLGSLTDGYGYDAFGTPSHLTGTMANNFLFFGQQYDEETGMYFLRARYYAPSLGRFLSQDPYAGNEGDPASLHRYMYADADPVNNTDPSGMYTLTETQTSQDIGLRSRATLNNFATAKNIPFRPGGPTNFGVGSNATGGLTTGGGTITGGSTALTTGGATSSAVGTSLNSGIVTHFFVAPVASLFGIANAFTWNFRPADTDDDDDPDLPVYRVSLLAATPQHTSEPGNYREYSMHILESRLAGKPKHLTYIRGLGDDDLGLDDSGNKITRIPGWFGPRNRRGTIGVTRSQLRSIWKPFKNGIRGEIYQAGGIDYGGEDDAYIKDLDEYPFASTAQAFLIGPHYKPIKKEDNQLGGRDLGKFYDANFGRVRPLGSTYSFRVRLVP